MPVCSDGVMRFPRLGPFSSDREAKKHLTGLTRTQRFELRTASGNLPKGYDHMSSKQKKLAKYIARGISIHDACAAAGVARETFYRWRRAHPLFRKYLSRVSLEYAKHVDQRLEGQHPRAVTVVEEAMHSGDPYFEYEVAKDLLKGQGKYKTSVNSQQQISGGLSVGGSFQVESHGIDKDLMKIFVSALVGKAQETKQVPTIDVKALPESKDDSKEVQRKEEG